MTPAEMRAEERHEHPVAIALVVVGAEPVEATVERDVPRVAETARNDLQVRSHVVAAQHAPFAAPVVARILIGGFTHRA